MSVPVNRRTHGKLEACSKAFELAKYTLMITKNKKIFTEEFKESLTYKIVELAVEIFALTKEANDLSVRSSNDFKNYQDRIDMQRKAIQCCGKLSSYILLAKPSLHLSSKRVTYWTGMTKDTRTLIKAWMESDKKRFSTLFEDIKGVG